MAPCTIEAGCVNRGIPGGSHVCRGCEGYVHSLCYQHHHNIQDAPKNGFWCGITEGTCRYAPDPDQDVPEETCSAGASCTEPGNRRLIARQCKHGRWHIACLQQVCEECTSRGGAGNPAGEVGDGPIAGDMAPVAGTTTIEPAASAAGDPTGASSEGASAEGAPTEGASATGAAPPPPPRRGTGGSAATGAPAKRARTHASPVKPTTPPAAPAKPATSTAAPAKAATSASVPVKNPYLNDDPKPVTRRSGRTPRVAAPAPAPETGVHCGGEGLSAYQFSILQKGVNVSVKDSIAEGIKTNGFANEVVTTYVASNSGKVAVKATMGLALKEYFTGTIAGAHDKTLKSVNEGVAKTAQV